MGALYYSDIDAARESVCINDNSIVLSCYVCFSELLSTKVRIETDRVSRYVLGIPADGGGFIVRLTKNLFRVEYELMY